MKDNLGQCYNESICFISTLLIILSYQFFSEHAVSSGRSINDCDSVEYVHTNRKKSLFKHNQFGEKSCRLERLTSMRQPSKLEWFLHSPFLNHGVKMHFLRIICIKEWLHFLNMLMWKSNNTSTLYFFNCNNIESVWRLRNLPCQDRFAIGSYDVMNRSFQDDDSNTIVVTYIKSFMNTIIWS